MSHSKKTSAGHVGSVKHLQTSLNGIEMKAKRDENHKFGNLCSLLNKWNLQQSWKYVNKKASSGVDGKTAKEFGKNLLKESIAIESDLLNGVYKANLIRRTYIDKSGGKLRPLGIPTVRDKLLQTLCSKILEAIYEPKFSEKRYGYRKGKGAKKAVKHLSKELNFGKYGYVVEADIRGYFENINHEKLLEMLEHDIADRRFIKLINKWLKAGILDEENIVERKDKGTPQGGVISPILANIYLHYILDVWFEKKVKKHTKGETMMMAYADDFVCAFRYKRDAERFMKSLKKRFNKFGLELAEEKTNLIKFSRFSKERNGSFNFLGFNYKWILSKKGKDIINTTTSKKKFKASVQKIKEWIKSSRNLRLRKLIDKLNKKLKGYYKYYGVIGNRKMLEKMELIVMRLLYKWLNRRSQRRSFNWKEFRWKIKEFHPLEKITIERIPVEKQMRIRLYA